MVPDVTDLRHLLVVSQSSVGGILMLAPLGQAGRVGGRFRATTHTQLGQQVGHVVLDGLLGQEEPLADLAVGIPSAMSSRMRRSWSVRPDSSSGSAG